MTIGRSFTSKKEVIVNFLLQPIKRSIEKANVGLTTLLVSRETNADIGIVKDVVLAISLESSPFILETKELNYDSASVFIKYEEFFESITISYKNQDGLHFDFINDVSNSKDINALRNEVAKKIELIFNQE